MMKELSPGQIYLADQRGVIQTDASRCYSSFSYGHYMDENRMSFGALKILNDEILAGGKSINISVTEACYLIIIPVTGALLIKNACNKTRETDVGEVFIRYVNAGDTIELSNQYPNDWINFLCLQITARADGLSGFEQTLTFDFNNRQNELLALTSISNKLPFALNIGLFAGRQDAIYRLQSSKNLFYAFIISGAFELQGRLVHERDGLALWDLEETDLEALSNNAVLLILEHFTAP